MNVLIALVYTSVAIFSYRFMKRRVIDMFPGLPFDTFDKTMSCFLSMIWPLGLPVFFFVWRRR